MFLVLFTLWAVHAPVQAEVGNVPNYVLYHIKMNDAPLVGEKMEALKLPTIVQCARR